MPQPIVRAKLEAVHKPILHYAIARVSARIFMAIHI